jgi:type II secretory ATPase GspE/PulE/Tfp pilus assembly ATPase PilB-like protein
VSVLELIEKSSKKYPSIVRDLDDGSRLDNDRDALLNIELYNLVDRSSIINNLNEDGTYRLLDCEHAIQPREIANEIHKIINGRYLVHSLTEGSAKEGIRGKLTLVHDMFEERIDQSISIHFQEYDVDIFQVTPLNWEILNLGDSYKYNLYDHLIYFKRVVYDAIDNHASDIHIVNNIQDNNCYIFYRILNDYIEQPRFKLNKDFSNQMITEIVNKRTFGVITDLNSSNGVKASWINVFDDNEVDLRITCSKTQVGYTCVTRIQTKSTTGKKIDELGFSGPVVNFLYEMSDRESGLTLITGKKRTGKGTTMTAIVNSMTARPIKFKEYSSPIEISMRFEQIDYSDSREKLLNLVNLAKKEDIDVSIINELPDKQVADAIYDLVNSSVYVMTTFHINRLWHLPYKLKDYFGESYKDLITQINGVCNQKMFVELCQECCKLTESREFSDGILNLMDKHNIVTFKKAEGCLSCGGTGRARKVQPYAEFLEFTDEVKSNLLKCETAYDMEDYIKKLLNDSKSTMEYFIAKSIKEGKLDPSDFKKLQ